MRTIRDYYTATGGACDDIVYLYIIFECIRLIRIQYGVTIFFGLANVVGNRRKTHYIQQRDIPRGRT